MNDEVNNFILYKFKKDLPCDCCPCLPFRVESDKEGMLQRNQVDKVE